MIKHSIFSLLLCSIIPSGAINPLQVKNDDLMRAAVVFLQAHDYNHKNGVMKVDARILTGGSSIRTRLSGNSERHDSSVLASVQIPSVAEVVDQQRAQRCASNAPLDCMSNGASVVTAFGRPQIRNDTAVIEVLILLSVYVSPADSVEIMKKQFGRMTLRMRRSTATYGLLTVVREGNKWTGKNFRPTSQT